MDVARVEVEEALEACSWCGRAIGEEGPVFGLGARARFGVDLSEYEGGAIRLSFFDDDREVICVVPPEDSDARQDGHDAMFMVCSERCASELQARLLKETALGEAIFGSVSPLDG